MALNLSLNKNLIDANITHFESLGLVIKGKAISDSQIKNFNDMFNVKIFPLLSIQCDDTENTFFLGNKALANPAILIFHCVTDRQSDPNAEVAELLRVAVYDQVTDPLFRVNLNAANDKIFIYEGSPNPRIVGTSDDEDTVLWNKQLEIEVVLTANDI